MIGDAIMRDGLQAIRRFLEEKRGFAGRVAAHFARMGRIISSNAVGATHGELCRGPDHWQCCAMGGCYHKFGTHSVCAPDHVLKS